MSTVKHEIAVTARNEFGKNASRRARKEGLVPAIVYSKGCKAGRAIFVKANEWEILSKHDFSVIYLVDGDKKEPAIVKEVQRNYMKDYVVHIDFQAVDASAVFEATIAIHAVGTTAGTAEGGVLDQLKHIVKVSANALNMPEHIEVDVSALNVGDSLTVGQLVLPEGVTVDEPADEVIFHVVHQSAEEVEPAEGDGEAAEATAEAGN